MDNLKKSLTYKSSYRGTKELDLCLRKFNEMYMEQMGDEFLKNYKNLLQNDDDTITGWIMGEVTPPQIYEPLINKIKSTL